MRSHLIIHLIKSSSLPIYQVLYSFFMHPIVFINAVLSLIYRVLYTYTIVITLQILFTMYKIQVSVFHSLNTAMRVVVFMYYFNQDHYDFTRL